MKGFMGAFDHNPQPFQPCGLFDGRWTQVTYEQSRWQRRRSDVQRIVLFIANDDARDPPLARLGTHSAEDAGDSSHARHQHRDRRFFARAGGEQMHSVNAPRLSEAFNASNPLLQTYRRPRQLEVDHQPASVMKVETFAGCVGGEQQASVAADELRQDLLPLAGRHSPVQLHGRQVAQVVRELMKRVAVLGEHNGWFARTPEQTADRADLGFLCLRLQRQPKDLLEPSPFFVQIRQSGRAQLR